MGGDADDRGETQFPACVWQYATGGAAAVGWNRQVIAVGFPLETMEDEPLTQAMAELVSWLGGC